MPTVDNNRRLVAFHMPKTGSAHCQRVMMEHGATTFRGHHDSVRLHLWATVARWMPVGTVRNPWDWYASWWLHAHRSAPDKVPTFRQALRDVTCDASGVDTPAIFYRFPWPFGCRGGLYSATLEHVYGDEMRYYVATDRLNDGLSSLLGREIDGATNTHHRRDGTPEVWPRPADHYAGMYDAEMLRWVYDADWAVIDRFSWRPFRRTEWALRGR